MTAGIRACKGESIRKAENDDYSSEAIREMEKRPEPAKYKRMISASVINTLATITLAIGILCIIGNFVFADSKGISLTAGLYCLIVSIPLYIISNIAEDIHYQSYLQELITDENEWYHTQSLRKLQSIENILKQQDYAPQDQTQQDTGTRCRSRAGSRRNMSSMWKRICQNGVSSLRKKTPAIAAYKRRGARYAQSPFLSGNT